MRLFSFLHISRRDVFNGPSLLFLILAILFCLNPTKVSASSVDVGGQTIGELFGNKGDDVFGQATRIVAETSASLYSLITYVCVGVLIISLIIAAVCITKGKPQDRELAKKRLVGIAVASVLVFSSVSVLVFEKNIVSTFNGAVGNSIRIDGKRYRILDAKGNPIDLSSSELIRNLANRGPGSNDHNDIVTWLARNKYTGPTIPQEVNDLNIAMAEWYIYQSTGKNITKNGLPYNTFWQSKLKIE